jgi:DNA-binding protein HU-beta
MSAMATKTSKAMSKSQIAAHLSEKFGFTKRTGAELLDELARLAAKEAKKGFTLPGIGKLVVVKRKARMGRNPQTGEAIKIPAKTVLKFRIAKAAKDTALGR